MKRLVTTLLGILLLAAFGIAAERPGELSKKELKTLLATAATPEDHLRLARHFEAQAKRYESEAAGHVETAKMYRARPTGSETKRPMAPDTAAHCDYLAGSLAKAAKEARAMAGAHEAMTKQ